MTLSPQGCGLFFVHTSAGLRILLYILIRSHIIADKWGDMMDTKRWKSVLVPREVYDEIKQLAQDEGRMWITGTTKSIRMTPKKIHVE
jgi:hypothetical protein